ncbi:MAG: nuclear transport factor 2 family protein [Proteobacteria bacterium]|nr:nuclear transport factor 2 family protein [Pseudomonadota bacterium]
MTSLESMTNIPDHPYTRLIQRYYDGCNSADVPLMLSTFTDDVVHYFVDHSAVRGASALANYWSRVGPRTDAKWWLDHIVIQEPEAVIEWSMRWVPEATGEPELLRGAEWYVFTGNRISEIRSYHNNYYLQDPANRELHDFDYGARQYRVDT